MVKITDFHKGQKAYMERVNNATIGRKKEDLIIEVVIQSVGKKYVTACGEKFQEQTHNNDSGLEQSSFYTPDFYLYPTKEQLEYKLEKEVTIRSAVSSRSGITG